VEILFRGCVWASVFMRRMMPRNCDCCGDESRLECGEITALGCSLPYPNAGMSPRGRDAHEMARDDTFPSWGENAPLEG
jgi:hypothetical protein